MKLQEYFQTVNLSDEKNKLSWNLENIMEHFSVSVGYVDYSQETKFGKRFYGFYTEESWICSDTKVGLAVYFFDGEPAAISWQSGRKMFQHWFFLSKEIESAVSDYAHQLMSPKSSEDSEYIGLEDDVDEFLKDRGF